MPVEVRIPTLGESITEGVIVRWIKHDGDAVAVDDPLLELETDKASVEIPAVGSGVLKVLKAEGSTVQVGDIVASIESGGAPARKTGAIEAPPAPPEAALAKPVEASRPTSTASHLLSPAVRKLVEEHRIEPQAIQGTGRAGRLTKADVLAYLDKAEAMPTAGPAVAAAMPASSPATPVVSAASITPAASAAEEERVPMTHLRKRIAERLVQAQHTAAILTTFNEVDMSAVMELRARYKERFKQTHGVTLGFMSFFARASISAIEELPLVNAQIDATDVVYKKHVHLGIAVGTERGLVVPIVHHADQLSFAGIEMEIERLAGLARQGKLGINDLSGGTFTISNGGVYGSLLSTPILNPPQSAILGMHKIEKRPVVIDDQIVIRPMMYLALSYDHRLIDGEQAVTFLVKVKERLEDPARLLLEV
ncbi:MAG: 2-oxoglutarate dehydrogenase complex dihydrolipoyllysine-residue succinyltransferase [Deltaproteobacteria bacterium]|nr:2-oxoglutarate dehydrogenase complex dihydrolipoyllysine-residue succinyltransferase [Deltaproteobacteria bacterium]